MTLRLLVCSWFSSKELISKRGSAMGRMPMPLTLQPAGLGSVSLYSSFCTLSAALDGMQVWTSLLMMLNLTLLYSRRELGTIRATAFQPLEKVFLLPQSIILFGNLNSASALFIPTPRCSYACPEGIPRSSQGVPGLPQLRGFVVLVLQPLARTVCPVQKLIVARSRCLR